MNGTSLKTAFQYCPGAEVLHAAERDDLVPNVIAVFLRDILPIFLHQQTLHNTIHTASVHHNSSFSHLLLLDRCWT